VRERGFQDGNGLGAEHGLAGLRRIGGRTRIGRIKTDRVAVAVVLCVVVSLWTQPARADEPPPAAFVEGVVGHPQEHNLSCESRSATDVAAFWGAGFAEDDFFRRLPKSDNPHRGFLGDVDLPAGSMPPLGYGVYVEPVAATLRSFGLDARARRGWNLDGLKAELAAGCPVVVWATYDMQLPGVETWVSSDGATSDVVKWQHTFIAVGYDEGGVTLVDAYDGETKKIPYEAFTPAWEQLGRMAVTVEGVLAQPGGRVWQARAADSPKMGAADSPKMGAADSVAALTSLRLQHFVVDGRWSVGPE
jgi:uncharacterized protein YvpB